MKLIDSINKAKNQRKGRTRARVKSASDARIRLSVFRSNTHLSVQLIDDAKGVTVFSAREKKGVKFAEELGKKVAEAAKKAGIERVVFDRGAYRYHGNVKAIAEGARSGGLAV